MRGLNPLGTRKARVGSTPTCETNADAMEMERHADSKSDAFGRTDSISVIDTQ